MSGLDINYAKSAMIPMNCEETWIQCARMKLGCSVHKLPITYLGVPLGANPRRLHVWQPVLDEIVNRLSLWKARFLSRVGRLVLIKFVLNSIPLYYLSLFRIPKGVLEKIIKMQRKFFWSSDDKKKGIPLVKWEVIQKPKEVGG